MAADFSPKPLENMPGNGFHINISPRPFTCDDVFSQMIAGILRNIRAMTAFLNPSEASYKRLGSHKAPRYITWSPENRSQLIRIPAAVGEYRRAELRSPDPTANPYLAFALMIYAGLDGIRNRVPLCAPADFNLYTADPEAVSSLEKLPASFEEACEAASSSKFIRNHIPAGIISICCRK